MTGERAVGKRTLPINTLAHAENYPCDHMATTPIAEHHEQQIPSSLNKFHGPKTPRYAFRTVVCKRDQVPFGSRYSVVAPLCCPSVVPHLLHNVKIH